MPFHFIISPFHFIVCMDVCSHVRPTVGMLGPRNLRVSDEWYTRFRVSWDPAPSRVNGYKLIYQPEGMDMLLWGHTSVIFKKSGTPWRLFILIISGSDESLEVLVGDVTSYQLHNLKPGTTYDLKVLAQYNTGFSEPLIGEGTTCKLMVQFFYLLTTLLWTKWLFLVLTAILLFWKKKKSINNVSL